MKLSFETLERLQASGRYKLLSNDNYSLIYYPPSLSEAGGEESEIIRTVEIKLRKVSDGYEVIGGLIKENGETIREISSSELELWLQFMEG
ncbi:MAG: hypothetical protein QXR57_03595 [Metallosphaera sp.]|uniref:hypothetical protein n=1 Tax=Metallosphaera sp. TaxID=2020860 RepID=UPI003160842E